MDISMKGDHRRLNHEQAWALINNSGAAQTHSNPWFATLTIWWQRIQERRKMAQELHHFPDEVLLDLGMTRQEAWALVNKPFWQA